MYTTTTFTYEELKQFILNQPLDKEIDTEDNRGSTCGCILIHFAQQLRPESSYKAGWTRVGIYKPGTADFQGVLTTEDNIVVEDFIARAINCQVSKYSEVLHLL